MRESLSPFDTYPAGSVYRQEEEKKECSHCRIYFRWIVGTRPLLSRRGINPIYASFLDTVLANIRRFFCSGGHNHHPVVLALEGMARPSWPGWLTT